MKPAAFDYVRADTAAEAVALLEASGEKFEFPVSWGVDLQAEHERYLTEKHVGRPVIVMNYPKEIKAFYMRLNDDGRTVAAMDVLAPGIGEIIGGSQREERLDVLDARMDESGLDKKFAEAPVFYWLYTVLIVVGAGVLLIPRFPLIHVIVLSQVPAQSLAVLGVIGLWGGLAFAIYPVGLALLAWAWPTFVRLRRLRRTSGDPVSATPPP